MVRKHLHNAGAIVARLIAWLIYRGGVVKIKLGRDHFFYDPRTGRLLPAIAGGAPDGDEDGDGDGDGDGDEDGDGDGDEDGDGDGDGDGRRVNWKSMARKHERRAKLEREKAANEKKRADELAAAAEERENASKSEQEKALEAARKEAAEEVTSKYETERRAERLELAVTRQATKGVKLEIEEDGKTVTKTIKFADPDDALAHLERAIKRGEVDGDEIFDKDGKVDKDALTTALAELLEDKPHLRAGESGSGRRDVGDGDGGKGNGSGKDIDEMSPAEHLKAIQKKR